MNEPIALWLCEGCGHYYQETERGQKPVTSCDCMTGATIFRQEFYQHPDPRVAAQAAVIEKLKKYIEQRAWEHENLEV